MLGSWTLLLHEFYLELDIDAWISGDFQAQPHLLTMLSMRSGMAQMSLSGFRWVSLEDWSTN